jgi:hypothetical protein
LAPSPDKAAVSEDKLMEVRPAARTTIATRAKSVVTRPPISLIPSPPLESRPADESKLAYVPKNKKIATPTEVSLGLVDAPDEHDDVRT